MSNLIDGKAIAQRINAESHEAVMQLRAQGRTPGLAVVVVGTDPASLAYVRSKERTCRELGMHSVKHELPAATSQAALVDLVRELNADPAIHGILVQSPPPPHIDERAVIETIDPRKDVDGFHPVNVAKIVLGDADAFVPCTPLGCQRLLSRAGVEIAGAHVVVLGRSMIVGKPLALLFMRKGRGGDATVTVAHSRTQEPRRSLPFRAISSSPPSVSPNSSKRISCVKARWSSTSASTACHDPASPKGSRLVGDVAFTEVAPKCRAITPVPGGVGPMTIAMLMANTIAACRRS